MAFIKKNKNRNKKTKRKRTGVGEDVEKLKPCALLVGM